ncbi:MAG: hypothetical protein WB664_06285 [Nitrososphaeraceae archaeon]
MLILLCPQEGLWIANLSTPELCPAEDELILFNIPASFTLQINRRFHPLSVLLSTDSFGELVILTDFANNLFCCALTGAESLFAMKA